MKGLKVAPIKNPFQTIKREIKLLLKGIHPSRKSQNYTIIKTCFEKFDPSRLMNTTIYDTLKASLIKL